MAEEKLLKPDETTKSKPPTTRKFRRNPSPLARCIEVAGDVNAGVLLYQIEYRFKHGDALLQHDGRPWIAQTGKCWCTETGLTPKQYKRALAILKEKELILAAHSKVRPHHKWQTTYLRLADGLISWAGI